MAGEDGLKFGRIGGRAAHVRVDFQLLFSEETEWHTPWVQKIRPNLERLRTARRRAIRREIEGIGGGALDVVTVGSRGDRSEAACAAVFRIATSGFRRRARADARM